MKELAIASLDTPVDPIRRRSRLAGLCALASVGSWMAALLLANAKANRGSVVVASPTGSLPPIDRAHQLLTFHAGVADQAVATAFRCLGLLLTAAVGSYLYAMVRARRPEVSRSMLWGVVAGALAVAGATVFGYFALRGVANEFVASGPRTVARAQHLIDASGSLRAAAVFDLVSRIAFAVWVGVASLQMLRADLLDRFLAYWGFGACISLVLLPIGDAMFIGWIGSIGVIALGYWPGGRPAGWTARQSS
jgi:hypothetical protein